MTEDNPLNTTLGTKNVIWNLADIYSGTDDPQLLSDMSWCLAEAGKIHAEYYDRVSSLDAESLLNLVLRLEKIDSTLTRLGTFSFLNFTTRLDNAEAGGLDQKIHELAANCGTETVFFQLEWNMVKDSRADTLLQDPLLSNYHHYLASMRRYQPHQLTEKEEQLLLEKEVAGRNSWTTLFDKIFGTLKFGSSKRTEEEVLTDLYHENRKKRKQAAEEMTEGLNNQSHILTHIFNTLAADKMVTDRLRHYPSWVSSMNLDNQLHDRTIETLIDAVTSRYDIVHRYYRVKRKLLGLDELLDYDRYAPLPSLPGQKISWSSCRDTVLSSFASFSEDLAEIAQKFFDQHWIHAPVSHGKRGGAFAHPCVPEIHPYVLVNYTGTLRDVSTVAHELGHGVHQMLSAGQGYYNSDTPLPLAETASVFAELLVFNTQLEMLSGKDEKRAFVCQKLESIFATVFRQTAMNRFEHLMHTSRRRDGELSTDRFNSHWLDTQRAMFGDSVTLGNDYGIWWSYIPHFLSTPGYVYSYAFGELLVLALYGLYLQEGQPFVEKYIALLSAGGSATPYELLQPFGIDLDSRTFWQTGLTVIEDMLKRVE
jgi:oligoendopeptidase F